jgi:hypothetical protein
LEILFPEPYDFSQLPPYLTSLQTGTRSIEDENVAKLPRSIQYLAMPWALKLTNEVTAFLPPHLTGLDLTYNQQLTSQCFQTLPPRLKYISFSQSMHRVLRETSATASD